MYALVGTLAAANLLALARFTTGRTARLGALFAVTARRRSRRPTTTPSSISAARCWRRSPPGRASCARWLPAAAVASVASTRSLLAAALLARHQAGGSYELGWFALPGRALVAGLGVRPAARIPSRFMPRAAGRRSATCRSPLAAAPALAACALLGLRALDWRGRLTLRAALRDRAAGARSRSALVLGVAVNPRYFQATVPAVLVLLAVGAAARRAGRGSRRRRGIAVGLLLVAGTALHLAEPGHGREDIAAAGAWLDAHVPAGPAAAGDVARDGLSGALPLGAPADRRLSGAADRGRRRRRPTTWRERLPWRDGRAVYVFGRAWVSDPEGALERDVRERFASCGSSRARGIRIYCLEETRDRGRAGGRAMGDHRRADGRGGTRAGRRRRPCSRIAPRRASTVPGQPDAERWVAAGLPRRRLLPGRGVPRRPQSLRPGRAGARRIRSGSRSRSTCRSRCVAHLPFGLLPPAEAATRSTSSTTLVLTGVLAALALAGAGRSGDARGDARAHRGAPRCRVPGR